MSHAHDEERHPPWAILIHVAAGLRPKASSSRRRGRGPGILDNTAPPLGRDRPATRPATNRAVRAPRSPVATLAATVAHAPDTGTGRGAKKRHDGDTQSRVPPAHAPEPLGTTPVRAAASQPPHPGRPRAGGRSLQGDERRDGSVCGFPGTHRRSPSTRRRDRHRPHSDEQEIGAC